MLLALSTCEADESCENGEPATLVFENRTGGVVLSITATPCDGGEAQALPLPDTGVMFTEQFVVALPSPGCWLLQWSGDGCTNEPAYRTSPEVCGAESHIWAASTEGRVCEGGW